MRALLVSIVVVGALLSGCGPGPARIGAGPASAANPQLHETFLQQSVPGSALGVAQAIAAGWSAPGAPAPALNIPIEFRTTDYTATVFNPGSPEGFTAFITTRRTTLVTTTSAATIVARNGAPARFGTPADQAMWRAAGRPSLGQAPPSGVTQTIPAGQYTFLPQGSNLTYRQAAALPADPDSLASVLAHHLSTYAGPYPSATLKLKQVAYLIATAPLANKVRAAAWQVMASLPGLRICPKPRGQVRSGTIRLCLDSAGDEIMVNINPYTGTIITIAEQLTQASVGYPHVTGGTIVDSSTFLSS